MFPVQDVRLSKPIHQQQTLRCPPPKLPVRSRNMKRTGGRRLFPEADRSAGTSRKPTSYSTLLRSDSLSKRMVDSVLSVNSHGIEHGDRREGSGVWPLMRTILAQETDQAEVA